MKSSVYRLVLFAASATTAATSLCFAQLEPVTLRIAVQPRPSVVLTNSSPNNFPRVPSHNSAYGLITSVNGEPARGSWLAKISILPTESLPDGRLYLETWTFNLAEADGTPAGVITAAGALHRGFSNDALSIVSGTNAYLGIQGIVERSGGSPGFTSGAIGAELTFVATLAPLSRPTVATRDGSPAIAHGKDFTPVTSNSPAEPGEILSLVATDVIPELIESAKWTSEPQSLDHLPVQVKLGGLNAKILYIGRYPGVRGAYQINFQAPAEVQAGIVDVQISTGFIPGPVATIPVR